MNEENGYESVYAHCKLTACKKKHFLMTETDLICVQWFIVPALCTHMRTHAQTHTHMRMHTYTHTFTLTHTCTHARTHTRTHTFSLSCAPYTHTHTYAHAHTLTHVCTNMHMHTLHSQINMNNSPETKLNWPVTLFQFNNCTKTLIFYFVIGFAMYSHYQLVSSGTSFYHFKHFPIEVHTLR